VSGSVALVPRCRSPTPCPPQQQVTICCKNLSLALPMMGKRLPETCWADLIDQYSYIIVASSWFFCITLPTLMIHGQTKIKFTINYSLSRQQTRLLTQANHVIHAFMCLLIIIVLSSHATTHSHNPPSIRYFLDCLWTKVMPLNSEYQRKTSSQGEVAWGKQ